MLYISIACWNKKRKLQAEPIGVPFPKHMCWGGQRLELYSFHGDTEYCLISPRDDAKTYLSYPKTLEPIELSNSCATWDVVTSAETSLYSLESRSVTKPRPTKSETLPELDLLHHDRGLMQCDHYEDHLLEFGTDADCSFSECRNNVIDQCVDKDLDDLLCSDGVLPANYVLSSGRWPVNQGRMILLTCILSISLKQCHTN